MSFTIESARLLYPEASEAELSIFTHLVNRTQLDPYGRQIIMIKKFDSQNRVYRWSTMTTIDGLRLLADRTGTYAPGHDTIFKYNDDDGKTLKSATCYVKKLVGEIWHEFGTEAMYSEYVQRGRDGNITAIWRQLAHPMTAKCSEALSLRRGWPAELSGLYIKEEMDQADDHPVIPLESNNNESPVMPTATKALDHYALFRKTMQDKKFPADYVDVLCAIHCPRVAAEAVCHAEKDAIKTACKSFISSGLTMREFFFARLKELDLGVQIAIQDKLEELGVILNGEQQNFDQSLPLIINTWREFA